MANRLRHVFIKISGNFHLDLPTVFFIGTSWYEWILELLRSTNVILYKTCSYYTGSDINTFEARRRHKPGIPIGTENKRSDAFDLKQIPFGQVELLIGKHKKKRVCNNNYRNRKKRMKCKQKQQNISLI